MNTYAKLAESDFRLTVLRQTYTLQWQYKGVFQCENDAVLRARIV